MKQYKWTREDILDKTNGGLDILVRLYPEGDNGGSGKFPHFKIHEEDHASSNFFKTENGSYIIKNHGGGDNMSPFDAIIKKTVAKDFYEALQWAVDAFSLGEGNRFGQAKLEIVPATKGQKDKDYIFDYKNKLSDLDLEVLGPLANHQLALQHNLKSCNYFIQVKQYNNHKKFGNKLMQIITRATDTYPILVFDMGKWQKIYQPLNKDKGFRFRYAGDKPKHFLFGKDLIAAEYGPLPDHINEHNQDVYNVEDDPRAPVIIVASGDRDALNTASLGYPVVWKTSEGEPLRYSDYKFLSDRCRKLCYLGDLDMPGQRATVEIALQYIDMAIIHLPKWLALRTYRGKPQKDMTDFCNAVHEMNGEKGLHTQFENLVKDALPARFWEYKHDTKGSFRGYDFNNEACYRFLQYQGFFQFKIENSKDKNPFRFIRIDKNVVHPVEFTEITKFPGDYVREKRKGNMALLNYMHRTPQLNAPKLAQLQIQDPDFDNTNGRDFQYFFFKNKIWEVTPEGTKAHDYGSMEDVFIWDEQKVDHAPILDSGPIFKIWKNEEGDWDIKINKKGNHFLNFMISTSRIHWRVLGDVPFKKRIAALSSMGPERKKQEAEIWKDRDAYRMANRFNLEEEGLDPELIAEQKLNLVNKIFAFGFLLHRYKQDSKAWSVYAMDDRISDVGNSNGGSGKSFVFSRALKKVLKKTKTINGGDLNNKQNQFLFSGVDKNTDAVIFDDLDSHYPIKSVYALITGDFNVNSKNVDEVTLDFKDSPKMAFTSNYGIYDNSSSTMRRILISVFADYYHYESDDDKDTWSYVDEAGLEIFTDFDDAMWSGFFNLCMQCCQFQMTVNEKIKPPMGNINKRNSLQRMGDAFKDWADGFFTDRKNILVPRIYAMEAIKAAGMGNKYTSQRLTKDLKEWCKIYGYTLNPEATLNTQERCQHRIDGMKQECLYIQTNLDNGLPVVVTLNHASGTTDEEKGAADMNDLKDEEKDDLPF